MRRQLSFGSCFFLAMFLPARAALPPAASAAPAEQVMDAQRYMAVDELRPGMRAVGWTVFMGTRVDSFDLEILGVMRNFSPGGDLILARAGGDSIARFGIVEGMSGSPVYVDGRLIGAVAYGWEFTREPMTGITPIGEMLGLFERESLPARVGSARPAEPRATPLAPREEPTALRTPVAVSGLEGAAADLLRDQLAAHHMSVVRSGTAGSGRAPAPPGGSAPLVPGAAVGVLLAGGDAEIAAIGTVTEVVGDRVLALGHPLLFAGDVDLPLTTAYVHGTVPLASRSFKMASPGETVGLVTGDRRAGIAGRLGLPADLMPVEVRIEAAPSPGPRTYRYQVIRDRTLSPLLSAVLAMNSLVAERALVEDGFLSIDLEADLAGGRRLVWSDRIMSPVPPLTLAERVQRPLHLLLSNPFAAPRLEGVRVTARVDSGGQWAWIEEARLLRPTVAPGDTVEAVVRLRPYRGPSLFRTLSIPVPVTLPEDTLMLRLCDADSAAAWDAGRAPDRMVPRSLEDVLRLLESERRHDAIYAQLVRRESGRVVGGRELPGLPTSVLSAMKPQGDPARVKPTQAGILTEQRLSTPFQVVGSVELPVMVTPRAPRH